MDPPRRRGKRVDGPCSSGTCPAKQRFCAENGIRLSAIGRRDRLPGNVLPALLCAEQMTAAGRQLHLRLAIDYSAQWECDQSVPPLPPVDLLIRTGGEQRLSDFLCGMRPTRSFLFLPVLWPDFGKPHWREAGLVSSAGPQDSEVWINNNGVGGVVTLAGRRRTPPDALEGLIEA